MSTTKVDTTDYGYALKELYPQDAIVRSVIKDNPWFAMCPSDERFAGKYHVQPIVYADPTGRSKTISVAMARAGGSKGVAFHVTRAKDYAVVTVDGELVEAAADSDGAMQGLVDALETEGEAALNQLRRSLGRDSFGDGTGSIGTIATIAANVITLVDAADVDKFEVGQALVFAANASSALRDGGAVGVITAVDRTESAPTVTIGSTPALTAAGDLIWNEGDYVSASDRLAATGLAGYIPSGTPAALFGVTRTVDRVRLAGHTLNAASVPINEALVRLASRVAKYDSPDCGFISHQRMEQLINLLGTKVEYTDTEVAGVGFSGIKIRHGRGALEVYADVNCPDAKAYVVTKSAWAKKSAGGLPKYLDRDGMTLLRHPSDDAYQARIGCYYNYVCKSPVSNGVAYNFGL